jgi:hypothetical protein
VSVLHACDRCRRIRELLARTIFGHLCATCWYELGEPSAPIDADDVHAAELATRERMLARGGEDRYRVRAGKA